MLLGTTLYYVLFIGSVLVGVAGLALFKAGPKWPDQKGAYLGSLAALIGGGVAAVFLWFVPGHVVVVSNGPSGEVRTEKLRLIGSTTVELGGTSVTIANQDDHSWIINRSNRPVQVESFVYSDTSFPNFSDPDVIPPMTAKAVRADEIEFIGPGNRPPSQISSKQSFEVKYWLTW